MASTDVVTLQDGTFDAEVLKSDIPVLVDFWAVWCGPCKAVAPAVEELAKQYKGKVKIAKMDVDEHQQVPQQYGMRRGAQRPEVEGRQRSKARASTPRPLMRALRSARTGVLVFPNRARPF